MSRKKQYIREQNVEAFKLFNYYKNMGMFAYKWELPEEIPCMFPEAWLFEQGQCVMLNLADVDPSSEGFMILPVAYGSERLDAYGIPTEWRAFAVGDTELAVKIANMKLNADNSVLIWNDWMRESTGWYVWHEVENLLRTEQALRINIAVQKTPFMMTVSDDNILTAKAIASSYFEGDPAIFRVNSVGASPGVEIFNPNVAFLGDKLSDQYDTFNNRILGYMGIDHTPVEKQERMLTGELESNDEQIHMIREARLATRRQACDRMNKLWGLNASVRWNEPEDGSAGEEAGVDGGEVRNEGAEDRND